MTIALVNQTTAVWSSGSTIVATIPAPANGNAVIVLSGTAAGTPSITGITLTGATFAAHTQSNTNRLAAVWRAYNVSGAGTTLTVTFSGTPSGSIIILEVSGLGTGTNGAGSGTSGASTAVLTPSITPTAGFEAFIVILGRAGGTVSAGPTGGFTACAVPDTRVRGGYLIETNTTGSYQGGWTAGAGIWEAVAASFLGAAASGGATVLPGVGAPVVTGFTPTVSTVSGASVLPSLGTATISGFAPTASGVSNAAPTASITTPANNAYQRDSQSQAFAGTGTDPEDGTLTGASLVWTSSIDGVIGTGVSFTKAAGTLTPGVHTITLTVTDSLGRTGTASVALSITADRSIPYYADGDATLYHQKCQIFIPPGSVPAAGRPVVIVFGGSSDRGGTGNDDGNNTSQIVAQVPWWPSVVLGSPTTQTAIFVFLQGVSSSVLTHYQHSWGLIDSATIPVAIGWSMNPNKVSIAAWSQGAFYLLSYLARPTSRRFAAIGFGAGKAPYQAVAVSDPSATTDAQAATIVAQRLGVRQVRQYWSTGDATVPPATAQLFRDAEVALPNSLFAVPGTSSGGYFDASPADHGGTASFMVADSSLLPWMLAQSSATEVLAAPGAVSFTGFAPTLSVAGASVAAGVGALTFTGFAPTAVASSPSIVLAGVGAVTAAGFAPSVAVSSGTTVAAGVGAPTLTGRAPTVSTTANVAVTPGAGQLAVAAVAAAVVATGHRVVVPGTGTLLLTGSSLTITIPGLSALAGTLSTASKYSGTLTTDPG